jgi:hypothetical protein
MTLPEEVGKAAADALGKVAGEVYSDVVHPAAREIGRALGTVFKVGLSPIAALDFGFEKSKAWLSERIAKRLETIPEDQWHSPPSNVAVPLLLAIASASDADELRNLYAELLMKSMDARTANQVHPSYVAVLQQLTPQEALVFISFRDFEKGSLFSDEPTEFPIHIPAIGSTASPSIDQQFLEHCKSLGLIDPDAHLWLDNLRRLRLLELSSSTWANLGGYGDSHNLTNTEHRHLTVTEYGASFLTACTPPAHPM